MLCFPEGGCIMGSAFGYGADDGVGITVPWYKFIFADVFSQCCDRVLLDIILVQPGGPVHGFFCIA